MITNLKKHLEPLVAIIAKPFLNFHPNVLTLFGLLFPILFFLTLLFHQFLLALLCSIGFLFDAVDGYVARKTNKTTSFGKIFDSTVDRLSDGICISAFGFARLVSWELIILILISSYLISYIQSATETVIPKVKLGGFIQRSERLIFLSLTVILSLFFPTMVLFSFSIMNIMFSLLLLLNLITLFQRLSASYELLKKL